MQEITEPPVTLDKIKILRGEVAKKDLKEMLQGGWFLVTGDFACIVDFKNTYYSDPAEEGDFIYKVFILERVHGNKKYTYNILRA